MGVATNSGKKITENGPAKSDGQISRRGCGAGYKEVNRVSCARRRDRLRDGRRVGANTIGSVTSLETKLQTQPERSFGENCRALRPIEASICPRWTRYKPTKMSRVKDDSSSGTEAKSGPTRHRKVKRL